MARTTLPPFFHGLGWVFQSREHYNFTYELEARNLKHMAAFLSQVTGCSFSQAETYLSEIQSDQELKDHILKQSRSSPEKYATDNAVRYGRRVGWYALVRALKPKMIVETGVDKGLGTVVLAAALKRNAQEGRPGKLIGIDINPAAGALFGGPYQPYGALIFKDSITTLRELPEQVDFFIHDSDHNPEFEAAEYQAVSAKLADHAMVLSDNAEHTDELLKFAAETDRKFLFFSERPKGHWWPGEGMGVAYRNSAA